jgi:ketohexokinase
VLAQLVAAGPPPPPPQQKQQQQHQQQKLPLKLHMVSCLPGAETAATRKILASFGGNGDGNSNAIDFSRCLYREGYEEPASSYIMRSGATGSRTIVNFSELPEMTVGEFKAIVDAFTTEHGDNECWWHFEVGRCGGKRKIKSLSRWTLPPSLCLFGLGVQRACVVLCCAVLWHCC